MYTSHITHRTSNIKHYSSNIEHRISHITHHTSNVIHITLHIQHRASNIPHPTSHVPHVRSVTDKIDKVYVLKGERGELTRLQLDGINFAALWEVPDVLDVHK